MEAVHVDEATGQATSTLVNQARKRKRRDRETAEDGTVESESEVIAEEIPSKKVTGLLCMRV